MRIVVEELNRYANRLGVNFSLLDWRQVVPDMGRPQQVILDQLKPEEWDLFIGILWHRFGTKSGVQVPDNNRNFRSGTEEEFYTAYSLWKSHGRPRIMFYHCVRPIAPDRLDPDQLKSVKEFFAEFAYDASHPGLYQQFRKTTEFVDRVRGDLMQFLFDFNEQAEPSGPSEVIDALPSELEAESQTQKDLNLAKGNDQFAELEESPQSEFALALGRSKILIAIAQLEGPLPLSKHKLVTMGRESYEWVSLADMQDRISKVCGVLDSLNQYHQNIDVVVFPEYSFPVEQAIEELQDRADRYNQIIIAGADAIRQPDSQKIFTQCPILIPGRASPIWITKRRLSQWEFGFVDEPEEVNNPNLVWKAGGKAYWLSVRIGLDFLTASNSESRGGGVFVVPMCSPDMQTFRVWADSCLRLDGGAATVLCNCIGGSAVGGSGLVASGLDLVASGLDKESLAFELPHSSEAVTVVELDCKHLAITRKGLLDD